MKKVLKTTTKLALRVALIGALYRTGLHVGRFETERRYLRSDALTDEELEELAELLDDAASRIDVLSGKLMQEQREKESIAKYAGRLQEDLAKLQTEHDTMVVRHNAAVEFGQSIADGADRREAYQAYVAAVDFAEIVEHG